MTRADWLAKHPDFPWLSADAPAAVEAILHRTGAIEPRQHVTALAKAGEGNMNLTLRATISGRTAGMDTLIVKQSRPWVEKYDFVAAPWDRALVEARFYQKVAPLPVAARMPKLLAVDESARVLVFQDLGPASDLTGVYRGEPLDDATIDALATFARQLHDATAGKPTAALANREMRALNHAHQYAIPLSPDCPVDLTQIDPGLATAATELRADDAYKGLVTHTGERYLADGDTLLHGDYFFGSFVRAKGELKVIDPEFCFYGHREYDLGVFVAHLALANLPRRAAERFLSTYGRGVHEPLLGGYAACEVMRRLIGLAQLPLSPSLDRAALLLRSRTARVESDWSRLWK